MKSPVKNTTDFKCTALLKQLIPQGSVVNSFLFYDGQLEIDLSSQKRFICAHTSRYVVYEFWKCATENPQRIYDIVASGALKFEDENMFYTLQQNWAAYKDPYVRAALFFILNRCSAEGMISSGKLDTTSLHPLALSRLRNFKIENFHLNLTEEKPMFSQIESSIESEYWMLPLGRFNYNLFEEGKSQGVETTVVHHRNVAAYLKERNDQKWIVIYKKHPEVLKLYSEYNIHSLNKYGLQAQNTEDTDEVVIANF